MVSIDGTSGAEERAPDAGLCRPQSLAAGYPARTPGGGGTLVAGPFFFVAVKRKIPGKMWDI